MSIFSNIPAWTEQIAVSQDTEIESDQPLLQANSICLYKTYNVDHAFENFDPASQGLHRFFKFAPQGGVITNNTSAPIVYGSPPSSNEVWLNTGSANASYCLMGTANVGKAAASLIMVPDDTVLGVGGCNVSYLVSPMTGQPLCNFTARVNTPPSATETTSVFIPYGFTFNKILFAQQSFYSSGTLISQGSSSQDTGYVQFPSGGVLSIAYLNGVQFLVYFAGNEFTPSISVWGI